MLKLKMIAVMLCLLLLVLPISHIGAVAEGEPPAASDTEDVTLPAEVFTLAGAQIGEDANGDYALRFGFNLGCTGVTMDENANTVIADDAMVTIDGVAYPLMGFGARVALSEKTLNRVIAADVPAEKLYTINDDGTVTYTARVIGMGEEDLKTLIYAKGYVTYRDGEEIKTHTTDVYSRSYEGVYIAINFPKAGDVVHDYLALGDVTIDLDNGTGTMVIKNASKGWECDQSAYLLFTCYNEAGASLGTVRINFGRVHAGKSSFPVAFTLLPGTTRMVFKQCVAEFWTDGWH